MRISEGLRGYEVVQQLQRGKVSNVYRAVEIETQQTVVIKVPQEELPSQRTRQRIIREYEIGKQLNDKNVVKYFSLEKYGQHSLALILEDFSAVALHDYIRTNNKQSSLDLDQFFQIALQLVDGLSSIHQHGIIHGSISSYDIVINTENRIVKFIDFGYASQLSNDFQGSIHAQREQSILAYISPEQTGRINTMVDARTDFYSLGIVFHELLCGMVPFVSSDNMEMLYCHIAKQPPLITSIIPSVPLAISNIIQIMLAKSADDRYQSTYGLKMDLITCQQQYSLEGTIPENLELKAHDICSTFRLKRRLYGRENAMSILLNAYSNISNGVVNSSLVLVDGYSGIGKTSLIHEIHKQIVRENGFFISGKFDQFKRNIPYSSIIQSLQQLVKQLLSQSNITTWKNQILEVLGTRAQIIVEVIPEVELIIGPQLPVPFLPPLENQFRFNSVFMKFIGVFARQEHPMILFLDDLQWADLASLNLLELLVCSPDIGYLLVVGSFRSNEVDDIHPLSKTITSIKNMKDVLHISLEPLSVNHIIDLIRDSLGCSSDAALPLAQLIRAKTEGNPLFIRLLLQNLVKEGLISFDFSSGKWIWDIRNMNEVSITENVVDMLKSRLQQLPDFTQSVLSQAACIGNKFELHLLSLISGNTSLVQTIKCLWPAIQEGVLIKISGEDIEYLDEDTNWNSSGEICFQFLHDKVQLISYELIPTEQRSILHLNIGRSIMERCKDLDDHIFEIVDHFRRAGTLIKNQCEKNQIACIALRAGKRAKDSSAFHPAVQFFQFGISLLQPDCWENNYELTFSLYINYVECQYLQNNFDNEELYAKLSGHAQNDVDKLLVYQTQVTQYEQQQKFFDAIRVGCKGLNEFGIYLPPIDSSSDVLQNLLETEIQEVNRHIADRKIIDLTNELEMNDPVHREVMKLMAAVWAPVYGFGLSTLFRLLAAKMTNFCLIHGRCDVTSLCFLTYALAHLEGSTSLACEFAEAGMKLAVQYSNISVKCRCWLINAMITCWFKPLRSSITLFEEAFDLAIESGQFAYASYAGYHAFGSAFSSGLELHQTDARLSKYLKYLKKQNQYLHSLLQLSAQPFQFLFGRSDSDVHEIPLKSSLQQGVYYYGRLMTAFWKNEKELLYHLAQKCYEISVQTLPQTYKLHECYLFIAISFLAVYDDPALSEHVKLTILSDVDNIISKLQYLSDICEPNVMHKLLLVKAEKCRVQHKLDEALEFYEEATEMSRELGFIQYEALAHELCGKMWLARNKPKYAMCHINEAYYLYYRYGAVGKLEQLKKEYPALAVSDLDTSKQNTVDSPEPGTEVILDISTVMKASKTISSESTLEVFLNKMMKLILENAGAQRGVFVRVEDDGKLLVVAEVGLDSIMIDTIKAISLESWYGCPRTIINFVARTQETVIISDYSQDGHQFEADSFFSSHNVKSVLCMPCNKHESCKGILYLENNLTSNAFSEHRTSMLEYLATQIAISLENARFSALLESEKKYRTLSIELESRKKRLEEFIDVLCHELRNPLNAIYGNATIITDLLNVTDKKKAKVSRIDCGHLSLLQEVHESVESISSSAHHLKDIVDTVLNISTLENKKSTLQHVLFKPNEVINLVVAMYKVQIRDKKLDLRRKLSATGDVLVKGDAYRLREILINLFSNSLKFTEQGFIAVSSFCEEKSDDIVTLHISVEDSGIGLSRNERDRLFQPFSQASERIASQYGGSGLGLKICKDLVELMNGSIAVKSTKGEGSSFEFSIELKRATEKEIQQYSTPKTVTNKGNTILAQAGSAKKKILIAEDNPINAKLLTKILQNVGHQTHVVVNGKEAVDRVLSKENFDLILMDWEMPVLGGLEATKRIRKYEEENNLPAIPIVGVSANARREYLETALNCGMNGYITKPYMKEDVYEVISKVDFK